MTFSPRAKALVHAILEHPRVSGNNWNAEIWGELYAVAEEALAAERHSMWHVDDECGCPPGAYCNDPAGGVGLYSAPRS